MFTNPATVRTGSRASTLTSSPWTPSAVMPLARNDRFVNVGFAVTDISVGVDEQLLICRFASVGAEIPNIATACAASVIRQFDTPMLRPVISTTPWEPELVPNLSRQYWIEPVAPGWNTIRFQSPRFGDRMEPLLSVSPGTPKLSSCSEVTVIVSPVAGDPTMVRLPPTTMPTPPTGLITTPGLTVRLEPEGMLSPPSST